MTARSRAQSSARRVALDQARERALRKAAEVRARLGGEKTCRGVLSSGRIGSGKCSAPARANGYCVAHRAQATKEST